MKPAAKIQAAIELLTSFWQGTTPADRLLYSYQKKRRYIGSKDRRVLSDLFYDILRKWRFLSKIAGLNEQENENNVRLVVMAYLLLVQKNEESFLEKVFSGEQYAPSKISADEKKACHKILKQDDAVMSLAQRYNVPEFVEDLLDKSFVEKESFLKSLHENAFFDFRINPLKANYETVKKMLLMEGIGVEKASYSPVGLRLSNRIAIDGWDIFKKGLIEVQDEGSQLASLLVDAKSSHHVLDYCSGAGGKALLMGAMMQNKGVLVASDLSESRLERAHERFRRAGLSNVTIKPQQTSQKWFKRQELRFDRVVLDVPCSGSGTWRRNPDQALKLTCENFENLLKVQQDILKKASSYVKSGGRLIYITCSVFAAENNNQIETFLQEQKSFKRLDVKDVWKSVFENDCPFESNEMTLQLLPYRDQTDGFFIAILEKL